MFSISASVWELVLRAAIVYAALFVIIRLTGKREVGELSPFDLVFLLLMSEQVSPALTGGDESVTAAMIGLVTLTALNAGVTHLSARVPWAERMLEGRPRFLIRRGKVDYRTMRREAVSKNELLAALRENGCFRPSQAEWAVLETDGAISVKPRGS
jgi:uncharacterized membrane protein YcaP (DUF421 family)